MKTVKIIYPVEGTVDLEFIYNLMCEAKEHCEWAGERYYARYLPDSTTIQFAVKYTFDRWANSVDFTYNGFPRDMKRLESLLDNVEYLIEEGQYDRKMARRTEVSPRPLRKVSKRKEKMRKLLEED